MATFISENFVTVISCVMLIGWFIFAQRKFKNYLAQDPFGDYEQPRTAATLGVLFTFIGIAWGLYNFDTNAIQQSVTNLLDGMKAAFVTSIFGMAGALYLKNCQINAQKNFNQTVSGESGIADLILYLRKSDETKSEEMRALQSSIEKLTAAIGGDGEYTVIGQIQKIRLDLRDGNDKIVRELRDFGKTLAENNTKAFIEALNETMRDFNQKLTEQFGENFKQLNVAVGRLLDWQINYQETVERVTKNLEMTFAGIDAAKNSIAEIEKSSGAIKNSSEQVLNLIVTANVYEKKLAQAFKLEQRGCQSD